MNAERAARISLEQINRFLSAACTHVNSRNFLCYITTGERIALVWHDAHSLARSRDRLIVTAQAGESMRETDVNCSRHLMGRHHPLCSPLRLLKVCVGL